MQPKYFEPQLQKQLKVEKGSKSCSHNILYLLFNSNENKSEGEVKKSRPKFSEPYLKLEWEIKGGFKIKQP